MTSILGKLFAESPYRALAKHAEKVHECVELVRPIVDALLTEDFERIQELRELMSKTEHEADDLKTEIRARLTSGILLSVRRDDLSRYLGYQDDVADAAQDFSVVASLRRTKIHPDLREDLLAFVDQVVFVTERMVEMARQLVTVANRGFTGEPAEKLVHGTLSLGKEEWKADELQRRFATRCYQIEEQLDPITLLFYDKFCATLSAIANKAENTGKFLHMLIVHR